MNCPQEELTTLVITESACLMPQTISMFDLLILLISIDRITILRLNRASTDQFSVGTMTKFEEDFFDLGDLGLELEGPTLPFNSVFLCTGSKRP